MNLTETAEMIKRHEGYNDRVYLDTVGVPTIGWGHALLPGSYVPVGVSLQFFDEDFREALRNYASLGLNLNWTRRAVVLDMIFNLGLPRFLKFKKFLTALKSGSYEQAAAEMLDSKWARQVGDRAVELANMMRI